MFRLMRPWFYISAKCQAELWHCIEGQSFRLPHTYLNIFFSEITWLFELNIYIEHSLNCFRSLKKNDHPLYMVKQFFSIIKVRKKANIRIRYNQAPHLTQDTTWSIGINTIKHHIQNLTWPWPILPLLRKLGERVRTFWPSSFKNVFNSRILDYNFVYAVTLVPGVQMFRMLRPSVLML